MATFPRSHLHVLHSLIAVCCVWLVLSEPASCQISLSNLTSFEPDLPIQHLTVDSETGDIYLGGTNFVYHLASNLSLIAKRSSNTADITNFCPSDGSGCVLPPEWSENENRVLVIDRENSFLVACGSAFNGTCVLHHLGSLGTVEARVHDPSNYAEASIGIGSSVVAYFGDTIVRADGQMATGLFVGASFNPQFNDSLIRQHAVSTKRLLQQNGRWNFDLAYQEYDFGRFTYIDVKSEYIPSFPIEYINGFTSGGFSFFTTVQKEDVNQDAYESRIVRLCNRDKGYYSYTEMPLVCEDAARSRTYNLLQAAHIGPVGESLALDLNTRKGDLALFGIFAQSSEEAPDQPMGHSALCIFTLKKMNRKITQGIRTCFTGYGNQGLQQFSDNWSCRYATYRVVSEDFCGTGDMHPIQSQTSFRAQDYLMGGGHGHHYTSLSTLVVGEETIAVMGTKSGNIHKYVLDPLDFSFSFSTRDYPLTPYKNIRLDSEGPVLSDMPFDPSKDHLYAMTPNKIYKIPLKTCEHYTHCSTCVTSNDPNQCGWCGGLCTTEEECLNREGASGSMPDEEVDSEDGLDWVTDACEPVIYEVSPLFGPLEGNTTVYIIGDSLTTGVVMVNATLDVTIADQPCGVVANASNVTHIVCVTPPVDEQVEGPVVVSVEVDDSNLSFAIGGTATSEPRYIFSYVEPEFTRFSPMEGPVFGGTSITLHGIGLRAGNTQEVMIAGVPCHVHRVRATKIHCITGNVSEPISGPVVLSLDNLQLSAAGEFQYRENPFITSISPERSYLSGDTNVAIYGYNLHLAQSLKLEVSVITGSGHRVVETQDCHLPWSETDNEVPNERVDVLECPAPDMRGSGLSPSPNDPVVTNLTVVINNHARLMPMSYDGQIERPQLRLLYYPDPVLKEFDGHVFKLDPESNYVTIYGEYLDLVSSKEEISVTVGNQPCIVEELHSTYLACKVPSELMEQGSGSGIYEVEVTMGGNHKYDIGLLQVPPPEKKQAASIVGTAIGIVALVGVVLVVVVLGIRRQRRSKRMRSAPINDDTVVFNPMEPEESAEVQFHRINTYLTNPGSVAYGGLPTMQRPLLEQINNELAAEISQVLIHEESLAFGKLLGQGHFGCVYAGKMTQDGEDKQVAIKSLHQGSLQEIMSFLREGIMMKDFHHGNVLTLIGVCINSETNMPYVVLPFMQNGDLLSFVREPTNELTARQLLEFCRQIATGMQYLSSLKFVHRDLAARNCMLDNTMTVKVADFGLSRDIYERDYYSAKDRTAKLPVRWMALECLERNIYNTRTDVWSFGVVMWELLTRGVVPYPSCDNIDILKFLHGGRRLPQPDHCPDHVYEVMLNCWSVSPIDRPTFCLLVDKLNGILSEQPEDLTEPETNEVYVNVPGATASESY